MGVSSLAVMGNSLLLRTLGSAPSDAGTEGRAASAESV